VCRRIVERHGGTITAHGEPGGGARFALTLPVSHRGPVAFAQGVADAALA
jgi:signal transduction histidine kinase